MTLGSAIRTAPVTADHLVTARKIVYWGQRHPETRYGSKGEQLFMEVQAQTVTCPHR